MVSRFRFAKNIDTHKYATTPFPVPCDRRGNAKSAAEVSPRAADLYTWRLNGGPVTTSHGATDANGANTGASNAHRPAPQSRRHWPEPRWRHRAASRPRGR